MADAYLPHTIHDVPTAWVIGADGRLFQRIQHYAAQGVVRVIAGPTLCHVIVDVQRPYHRPRPLPRLAPPHTGATT